MPMTEEEITELKAMFPVARKGPVSFGLCLGKKPETTALYIHRKKAPEILGRQAKKASDSSKLAFGTVTVKGKKLLLQCEGDVPGGLAKKTKEFLNFLKTPMKIIILDATGKVLESDGEDDEDDGEDGVTAQTTETSASTQDGAPDPNAELWKKTATEMMPKVARYVQAGVGKAPQVKAAWEAAAKSAKDGNFKAALGVAAKIQPLLTASEQAGESSESAPSPDETAWTALLPVLEKLFKEAMDVNPPNRSQLEAAWAMATEKAEGGDFASAVKIAARLRAALETVIANTATGAKDQDSIPDNIVPFQRASMLWRQTRERMFKAMATLEDAIIAECSADEELAPLADEARDLTKRLSVFDTNLIDQLDNIANSPIGAGREALKKEANNQIRVYAAALNEPFFKDVDNNNGFVSVAVASAAREALLAIAKTLK